MASSDDLLFDPHSFDGVVRLFPLPNLVLFPQVVQPLHVFEPRYRDMMEDALAGDRLIAMAVLAPGWEEDYEGRPAVHSIACLGRIATHTRQPDGKFNLLLVGLRRLKIVTELPPTLSFRQAEGVLLTDHYAPSGAPGRTALHARLRDAFKRRLARLQYSFEQLDQLVGGEISLGTLTDLIGYTLDLEPDLKLELLGEIDVDRRATRLLEHLEADDASKSTDRPRQFPPDFSLN